MPEAVKSNLFLYADDTSLAFQGKHVIEIEKQLNGYFTNICKLFMDNKFSIHFGEDKTKSIHFASIRKIFNQFKNSFVLKYFTNKGPTYLNEVFELGCLNNLRTGNSCLKLTCPFQKTNAGQKAFFLIVPSIWNIIAEVLKKRTTLIHSKITYKILTNLNKRKLIYDIITMIIITLFITRYYYNYKLSSVLLISLYYSYLQVFLLPSKLLLTLFCFSYYFKFYMGSQ